MSKLPSMYRFSPVLDAVVRSLCTQIDNHNSGRLLAELDDMSSSKTEFPDLTQNWQRFAEEYMLHSVIRKVDTEDKASALKRKDAALRQWLIDEEKNSQTNSRVHNLITNRGFPGTDLMSVISHAQERIRKCLGEFSLDKVLSNCGWGPGATFDIKRSDYVDTKLTKRMSSGSLSSVYMKLIIEQDYHWMSAICGHSVEGPVSLMKDFFDIQESTRLTMVPKDREVDRVIDPQFTADGYLQVGVGRCFRRCLRKWGVDLRDQGVNQLAAFDAVVDNLATLDLKNASNTLTTSIVHLLLPVDWFIYLDSIRAKFVTMPDGSTRRIEKFSAMGNGFTFELETLVFHALAYAASKHVGADTGRLVVYGDDVIVSRDAVDMVTQAYNYCGFSINEKKSFSRPPFFESCGAHFFESRNVTPFYQKCLVNTPEECVRLYNRIVRWSTRIYADPYVYMEALTLLQGAYLDLSDKKARKLGLPLLRLGSEGDDGFLVPDSELKINRDGSYFAVAIRPHRSDYRRLDHRAYYALKMRTTRNRGLGFIPELPPEKYIRKDVNLLNGGPTGSPEEKCGDVWYKPERVFHYS